MKQKPKKKNIDFIKKRTHSLIVSIGDVGNDINMIRQVNVVKKFLEKMNIQKKVEYQYRKIVVIYIIIFKKYYIYYSSFFPNIFKEYRDSNIFNIFKFFTIFGICLLFR